MGVWAERVVPRLTDKALGNEQIDELRSATCAGLHGRVLEIGFGSGLNLPHYPPEVSRVDAVEPADAGWRLSRSRRERSEVRVERTGLDGQRLEADDATYDAVLSTFTLCTIPDAATALAEVHRVLRPGGSLHFVEHGLAPDEGVVTWQRRLEPLQKRLFAGCHLTRDVPALVGDAGLEMAELEARYLPGPGVSRPWSFGYRGRASRP
jgi:ubiquinone/menaquinone biosynthesis C-methylase UbiE